MNPAGEGLSIEINAKNRNDGRTTACTVFLTRSGFAIR
jgi:hypothetical protein